MAAGGSERTSGYFGDQTPSETKKPCFPSRIRFYHFWGAPEHFRRVIETSLAT
jgi:hypothetical protein